MIHSLFIPIGCQREDLKGYMSTLRYSNAVRGAGGIEDFANHMWP